MNDRPLGVIAHKAGSNEKLFALVIGETILWFTNKQSFLEAAVNMGRAVEWLRFCSDGRKVTGGHRDTRVKTNNKYVYFIPVTPSTFDRCAKQLATVRREIEFWQLKRHLYRVKVIWTTNGDRKCGKKEFQHDNLDQLKRMVKNFKAAGRKKGYAFSKTFEGDYVKVDGLLFRTTSKYVGKLFRVEGDDNTLGVGIKKGDVYRCTGVYEVIPEVFDLVLEYKPGCSYIISPSKVTMLEQWDDAEHMVTDGMCGMD